MALQTSQQIGLQAMNDPTRIAGPVQNTLPKDLVPDTLSKPTRQLTANIESGQFIPQGENTMEKMTQELFGIDQQLEGQQSPFPNTPGFVENPADQVGSYANYAGQLAGQVGRTSNVLNETQSSYDRAVGGVLDRFLDFYELQQRKEEQKQQEEYKRKKDQLDFEIQMAQMTGGTVTNPFTGEKYNVPVSGKDKDPLDEMIPLDVAIEYGLPIGTTYREMQGQQIGSGQPAMTEEEAILQVLSQGGGDILSNVGVGQKGALAESILGQGGVGTIRQTMPITEMMSGQEVTDQNQQQNLLQLIDRSIPMFTNNKGAGGTGFLAGFLPNWMPFQGEGRELRGRASEIESELLRMFSGTQVTPSEAERLRQFIPTRFKSEEQNLADLGNLKRGIQINQDIFEYSKRQGKSMAEAYREYGPVAFANAGEQFPGYEGEAYANAPSPQPSVAPSAYGNGFINQINAANPVSRYEIIGVE